MDWKGTVDRKKNCMKLFAVLQDIFSGALAESDLVTASEDMEYKLMVTHESLEKFERDLTRVYSRLKRSKLSSVFSKIYDSVYNEGSRQRCCRKKRHFFLQKETLETDCIF